jgi:uncharacterized protein (TIGR02117 family)
MNNIVIFPVIFFFLHTSPALQVTPIDWECCDFSKEAEKVFFQDDSLNTIYIIKQRWHTAVVFHTEDVDTLIFPEIKYFKDTELIDIGWGDEAFYQHPDFDWDLAYHALFQATPSTLRVEGINITKQQYFDISEIVLELKINNEQLKILLKYISETIWRDENENYEILSTQYLNRVYFFKANGSYHLFNTCNTWVANGLKRAGFEIENNIVLTEQLFNEAAQLGDVIKSE